MEESSNKTYCICNRTIDEYDEDDLMIECDVCNEWFHGQCLNLKQHQINDIDKYVCPKCQNETNKILYKERKNYHRHDYADENADNKPIQAGTPLFIKNLLKKSFPNAEDIIKKLNGCELTTDYLDANGFSIPILVENINGLKLKVPLNNISITEIVNIVGKDYKLDVIDVEKQDIINMTICELEQYFENKCRNRIYNLISLEISNTKLDELVSAPNLVHEISWVSNGVWPNKLPEDVAYVKPEVQKYCLISAGGSYTDFHIDFGGSSVWYHCLKGNKLFYLIEPTEKNLDAYEKWSSLKNHTEVFLPDQLDGICYQLKVNEGNTIFLPSGWIHAVYTPSDSIVFGGNFEHSYSIPLQIKIYELECRLKVIEKYRFPSFETLQWYAAKYLAQKLKKYNTERICVKKYLYNGLKYLRDTLKKWVNEPNYYKLRGHEVPKNLNCEKLLTIMTRELRKANILLKENEIANKNYYKPNNVKLKSSSTSSTDSGIQSSSSSSSSCTQNDEEEYDNRISLLNDSVKRKYSLNEELDRPKIPKLVLKLPKNKDDHVSIKQEHNNDINNLYALEYSNDNSNSYGNKNMNEDLHNKCENCNN